MGLIEKLQEIKTKLENYTPSGGGSGTISGFMSLEKLFRLNTEIEEIDISSWDISKISSLNQSFEGCWALKSIKLPVLATDNLKTMYSTFDSSSSIESLDFTNFNTKFVYNFQYTFYGCSNLKEIKNLDITSGTSLNGTFSNCYALEVLDFSGTENVSSNFSIANSTKMSVENFMNMIDTLPTITTSKTITVPDEILNNLSEEQLAIVSSKGYTLA